MTKKLFIVSVRTPEQEYERLVAFAESNGFSNISEAVRQGSNPILGTQEPSVKQQIQSLERRLEALEKRRSGKLGNLTST